MKNVLFAILKGIVVGLLPSAYIMIFAFLATLAGYNIFATISLVKIVAFIISIKIITFEIIFAEKLYKDVTDRTLTFFANFVLFVLGLTLFSFS